MKILINLIGGQTAPNFIAYRFYNPDKIINLSTGFSTTQSENLKLSFGADMFFEDINIPDAYDISDIKCRVKSIISDHSKNNDLILNFTGATKPISIAAFDEFISAGFKCIYVDSENNRIFEYIGNQKNVVENFECKISIDEHFKMYGKKIIIQKEKNRTDAEERNKLKLFLKENYYSAKNLIGMFFDAYNADKKYFKNENIITGDSENSVRWIKAGKKLNIVIGENKFYLVGDTAHKYFTGLWFEDLVKEKLAGLNCFDEMKFNVEIPDATGKNIEAEMDVVAVKNHKLHIFECKSGILKRDFLFKLAAIKNFSSNLYAKIYFITFEEIESETYKNVLDAFKIKIIPFNKLSCSSFN